MSSASHVVVGGGVNGLSVAWALAERGADVVVLDKGRIGGGASGIAGGIVRNYYRSEPIAELVRLSVEMFEEEPEAYGFRQVGYIAAVPRGQVDDLVAIRVQHDRVGYDSELVMGAGRVPRVPDVDVAGLGRAGGGAAARAPERMGGLDADGAAAGGAGAGGGGGDPRRAWR